MWGMKKKKRLKMGGGNRGSGGGAGRGLLNLDSSGNGRRKHGVKSGRLMETSGLILPIGALKIAPGGTNRTDIT